MVTTRAADSARGQGAAAVEFVVVRKRRGYGAGIAGGRQRKTTGGCGGGGLDGTSIAVEQRFLWSERF